MNRATLRCGTLLTFESQTFVPAVGDTMPCRRHDFCAVESTDAAGAVRRTRAVNRASPRTQRELVECLQRRPATTVHVLRRQRFTLRLVAAAERDGLLDVDIVTGAVVARDRAPTCII